MDVDLPAVHRQALARTGTIVAGIRNEQLAAPSPCDGWDVRGLLNHVVAGNFWVKPLVEGESIDAVGDRLDGDLVGDTPAAAYERSALEADTAFSAAGAMERPVAVSYGPVPGEVYCGHRFIDVFIHGWDLAKATGQPTTLDPGLVEACWAVIEPQREMLEASGAYGTPKDLPADADRATQLLAALGRTP